MLFGSVACWRLNCMASEDRECHPRATYCAGAGEMWCVNTCVNCRRREADFYCCRVFRNHHSPAMGSTTGMKTYPDPKCDHTVGSGKSWGWM